MTEKNYKTGYTSYDTLAEAQMFAKRDTARSFAPVSIWQRIEETVVPTIDVTINAVEVSTVPVA